MEEKIPTYDETTEVSDIPSYDETSAVDEVAASSKKKVDALNSSAGTLSMDVLRPENNPTQEPKTSKEEALNAVVAKSQAGYINPDLEDFNKPQVTNQTAKKETPIDDLVLTNRTLRQMRNFSENTTAKATADLERIKQEGITLRDQYNSNPSYDLEQKMFSKEVEYKAAEKKANLSALQREVYNRRLMETSESIKKMANDKVPDGIYSAIYKGIKGNVKDTEKAIEMSRASKAEQIQWAKDEALKAPTIEQGKIEQGAEMVGGVLPDIATAIGFSLVGLPTVGVGAVSARQGAQQAGQDFVRAFNDAQENGIDTGGKYPNGDPIIRKATDDEAYEIATKAAGIGFATGAAEGLVGAATGRVGAKLASKAASKATAKAVEKGVDTGLDASIAGTMQVGRNVFDRYQGLNTELGEGVLENAASELFLSGPINTFAGIREYVADRKKSTADIVEAIKEQPKNPYKLQKLEENLEVLKESNGIKDIDYKVLKTRIETLKSEIESGSTEAEANKVAEREEKKVELTSVIEDGDQALKTVMDAPAETPFEKAQQEVLISKVKESQKAAFEELKTIATEEIDEFERKAAGDNTGVEQQVEVTPPVKIEGVGEGAEAEATKESELKKLEDELAINLAKAEKESDAKPIIKTKRADGTIDTNSIRENAIQAANSLYEYGVKRVNEKYAAQEVKPKTEAPESGNVGVDKKSLEDEYVKRARNVSKSAKTLIDSAEQRGETKYQAAVNILKNLQAPTKEFNSYHEFLTKAVEQPLKETTKAGSVGVEAKKADIERRRQEDLEKKVQILKDKRNALRGEDGVVPKENIAEWQQLGKDVIEAQNKATRGNNEGFIPIRTEKDGVLSGEDAINAENEIERVIQKIIKGEITIEQAVSFIHNKYKVLANENEFLLNYINDRTSNAPEIGNNKQSFPAWRKGKYDAELKAVEQSLKETTKAETTKKDFEQVKTEKERLKNLVTAIEKKQPYDKKEVDFFSSDQSALFNKSGVPVELQVALEEAKKEPKVETDRQARVNKIVEMADEYNSLFQGKRGRATSDGYDLLNRVRQLAADNGFTAAGGTGRTNVTILNKSGNIVRAKYASSSNKDLVEDYIPLSERDEKVQEVFNTLSSVSALALPTVRNAAGARFSKDQMESAVRDILKNKPTAGAKRVLDALDQQVQDGNIRIEDPVMGNMSVPLKDYLGSFTEEFSTERAEESRDQAALAKEYETWFNNLTDEEKQNENKYLDAEFDTETESASDVADQTPAVAEIDKASSSNKGDNEKPVSKESGTISEVSTNKSKTDENVKGNKKAERRQKGLLGPGKKFYSYLVSQGMSKASAALNTAVFTFSVARRAAILGKPVSEVMDEYRFGDETQTIRLNDKDVEVKSVSPDVVNGFYSPLEKIISETKFDKLPAKQWAEKFAKGEEAKWTGLTDWLNSQPGSVSKADIQNYLKDNRIQVVEVVKSDNNRIANESEILDAVYSSDWVELGNGVRAKGDVGGFSIVEINGNRQRLTRIEAENLINKELSTKDQSTKFQNYQLEGEKENYREVLVTMPSKQTQEQRQKRIDSIDKRREDLQNEIETLYKQRKDETKEYKDLVNENEQLLQERQKILYNREDNTFRSSHFDEPNILVHLRMNTRTDAEGNKVLFLEEVQSDWGQKGKKEGFVPEKLTTDKNFIDYRTELYNKYKVEKLVDLRKVAKQDELATLETLFANENDTKNPSIPTAPFVTDTNAWTKLGLKVALKEAVKQGADKIAWTTGEQQNDRYDLSKQVKRIDVEYVDENLRFVDLKALDGKDYYMEVEDGKVRNEESSFAGQKLEDVVGKDVAEKILTNGTQTIEGDGLKVGGKGMKGFYGSPSEGKLGIVGEVAKSLFKQEPKTVVIGNEKAYVKKGWNYAEQQGFKVIEKKDYKRGNEYLDDFVVVDKDGYSVSTDKDKQVAINKFLKNSNFTEVEQQKPITQHSIDITPELKAEVKKGQALFQDETGVRGSWAKAKGQRLLSIYSNAKNTTAVHEALGHDYLDTIIQAAATGHKESSEDIDVIIREYKKDNRNTPTDYTLRKELEAFDVESMDRERDAHAISIHEWFAKKAEEYMANPEMKGASVRLKRLFEKFIIYLRDLHNTLAGKKVSEPMRKIFQKAFGEDYDIAQEAIEKEMEEVSALEEVNTPSDELFNSLLDVSNVLPNDKKLFDAAFDEKKSKETLIALAQKLILEGKAVKDVIPTIKKMVENSAAPAEQKEFLSKLIDKSAADMILDPVVYLGENKATRRGIQKQLENPDVPEVVKEQIRKKKDLLEYQPITIAEGDAFADAAISLYGLDVVDKWVNKMLQGNKPEQVYAARVFKKLLEAQTTLINKYAADGNETLYEITLRNQVDTISAAAKLSTKVAQQLRMFAGVFGHPEAAVRAIEKELTNVQKVKIAKRDKIREMLKDALAKLEITNEELLQQTFELEETQEQLRDKIVELESETRSRAAAPKSLPKKPGSFENPKQAFEERVAQLKAMRQARGLSDADSEATVLKEATELLFEMDGKAYSFPQYAKKMRAAVDDKLTDQELADAYKAVRDEQGLPLDGDDVIGALLHKKIVKDEELAAAKAEKVAMKSASKAKLAAIAAGKKAVLDKLKDAGFKRGDHVDWRKIATERMQNPDKAAEIINEAIDSVGGLTASEKLGMKLEMLAKLDETIREHKTRLVEQILKDNDVSPNKKNKGDIDKIVALLNTLSDESSPVGFKNALNKLLGIESIPTKDLKRIRELGQALQVEELRMERQAIMNEMYNIFSKYKGGRGARILADFYYADMLSGPITQLKNLTNRFNIWANLMGAYIRSGGDKNLLEVAKNSRNRGILMSTLQRGISLSRTHLGENFYGNSQHVSEFEFFRERNLRDASGKLTIPTVVKGVFDRIVSSPKYVGRSLDGIDGENWIRMYDQAQYRFLVRMFKARGLTTETARDKAIDIMRSPLGEMEAMERAKKIYSAKKMKVSDATLKRAAYDLIQQAREKQAAGEGIDNLEEIGHALANWITFKGDAYGPTEDIPVISRSTVKGLNYLSEEFGKPENGKRGKAAQFLVNAIRIITIPFVNSVARIVTRGLESALGIGFAKSWYQYSRAKDETGIEREMAVYQAQETLNSAIGSTIAFYAGIHGLVAISQALYDDEDDKWASGFYSRIPSDNPAVKSRPGYALHVFGMWIPFGWLGTFAIPAAVSAAVSDHYRMKKLSGEEQKFMIAVNTINTVLGSSFLQTQNNFKDYVSDVLKGGDVSGKTKEAIIRGSASVTANLIPLKSFFNQVAQMFTNAEDKEARTFVQNIVKYSIGGIGLKPRIDYMGRVVKAGKKNPESAAGVTEMFNEWGYDNRDKMIASFGIDFPLWNRSQKTLYFNDRPISDEKYYDFQKQANTNFGQYMRYYVNNLRVVSDPKQSMSNKRFRGIIIKELHSLANKKAMSSMFITGENKEIIGENKEIISPEQIEKELSKIDEFFK